MNDLYETLRAQDYQRIKFKISKTNHLLLGATINGVRGDFILDTGASNSCVGFDEEELFKLTT
jgi:predicted aspartyl protease